MPTTRIFPSLLLIVSAVSGAVCGQEAHHPRISIVHPGPENLTGDLKSIFDLTTPEEQESWIDLEDILVITSSGIDPERPVRMDMLTGLTPVNYLIWLPFADDDGLFELRDNLDAGLGFQTIPVPGQKGLYRIESLDNDLDEGWFRVLLSERYVVLVLTTPQTRVLLRQMILRTDDPLPEIASLAELGAGVAVAIVNVKHDAESLEKRRDSLREIRAVELDALQRRPTERTTEFNLRKDTYSFLLDEYERLLAEADNVEVWGDLDRDAHVASLRFRASAIPETSLAVSISEFGVASDAFAGVGPLPDTVFSGRLNHPLDQLRQRNLNSFMDLLSADIESRVAASETLSVSEKEATSALVAGVITIVRDGAATGNINGFAEATHDGTRFTMVGAVSAPDATRLTETFKQIPLARADNSVEFGIAAAGEVTIHRIRLAEGFVEWVDRLFGAKQDFYVGVGADHVWMAAGPGAQDAMIQIIGEFGEAAPSETALKETALKVDVKLHPWIQRLRELAEQEPLPEALEDRRAWREDLVLMKQAVESLVADDEFHFEVSASEAEVSGFATFNTGLLRFLGRRFAKFSKENLGVD